MLIHNLLEVVAILNSMPKIIRNNVPKKYHHMLARIYFKSRTFFYIGDSVICPCCDKSFREFSVDTKSPGKSCPECGCYERSRLLWFYLKYRTNFLTDKLKVLHIAPEYSLQKKFKSLSNLEYISADLNSSLAMIKMDITNIQYKNNYFDVIICYHVLEHIIEDQKAMSELFRVLKPHGWAIIQSPIDSKREMTFEDQNINTPEDREKYYGLYDHVRIYGLDYKNRLERAGFNVIIDEYAKTLDDYTLKKYGIDKNENIYLCKKCP